MPSFFARVLGPGPEICLLGPSRFRAARIDHPMHDSLEKVSVALAISSSAEGITGSAQFNGSS